MTWAAVDIVQASIYCYLAFMYICSRETRLYDEEVAYLSINSAPETSLAYTA